MFIESILSDTKIVFERNISLESIDCVINYAVGKKVHKIGLVVDENVSVAEKYVDMLKKFFDVVTFSDIKPNPDVETVDKLTSVLINENVDVIWVIGGGSFMDSAKAASVLIENGGSLEDYLGNAPVRKIDKEGIPVIASPTTAGTGAEVTRFGVYTSNSGRKYSLVSNFLQPKVAFLIPELTYSLPSVQTAATSFDALTHALEPLWNKNATDITDKLAINVTTEILKAMEMSYNSSVTDSTVGRDEMLIAATKAGITFNITGTAAIHALSFPLSEKWHIPHGTACSFFFEDVWQISAKDDTVRDKLLKISEKMGFGSSSTEKLFNYITDIKMKMKLPVKFSDLSIDYNEEEDFPLFLDTLNDPKIKNSIAVFTEESIMGILQRK